jgi:Uma2 family endonuclease
MKTQSPFPREWSVDDLIRHLAVPASRIRLNPPPGTAVEADVLRVRKEEGRLCELIDGVLVEKTMGMPESKIGLWIAFHLQLYLQDHDLGELGGADGPMRLMPGQVRIPDVSFTSHRRNAESPTARDPIPEVTPDLAIEVISEGNSPAEIARKVKEYFFAGTSLVWVVDPRTFTVDVYTAPDQRVTLDETQQLSGDPVLPGLRLSVARIFEKTPRPAAPKRPRRKKKS